MREGGRVGWVVGREGGHAGVSEEGRTSEGGKWEGVREGDRGWVGRRAGGKEGEGGRAVEEMG